MLEPSDKGLLLDVAGWGLGLMTLPPRAASDQQKIHGIGGGFYGYAGLMFATRDAQRRVVISFNTASNDPTSATHKLVRLARLVLTPGLR